MATQLTVVGVVSDDVVPSAPVPQKKSGVSGARHDVAVSSDVGLGPGQTRNYVPVAEHDLGQLSWEEEEERHLHQWEDQSFWSLPDKPV